MSLNKVRGVFVSILLLRLVYLLSVTIQAPLGSESLRSNLTRKVLMIFFMLKKQPIVHESLWFLAVQDSSIGDLVSQSLSE